MRRAFCFWIWTVCTIALLSTAGIAQDAPAEKKEKAAKKAEGKSEGDAKGAEAIRIPWDDGKFLEGVPQSVKRLYRLKKTGQWSPDRLPKLCQLCLETGNPKLKMYATWYQALIAGHNKNEVEAKKKLKEAIDLGYLNVTEMQESEELLRIREDAEVKGWIDGLRKKLTERMIANFQKGCDANFKAASVAQRKPWGAELKTLGGERLVPAGKPAVLVVARTHHDPLEQQIPELKRLQEKASVSLLFWQMNPADPHRIQDAQSYVDGLKRRFDFSAPAGLIGRKEYLELRGVVESHFLGAQKGKEKSEDEEPEIFKEGLPYLVIIDATEAPVDSKQGAQAAWQIDYLLQKISALPVAALPEPPKEEEKPATLPENPPPKSALPPVEPPKAEEKPATPPEKPAPPPAPAPAEGKPEEKPATPPDKPAPPPAEEKKPAPPADEKKPDPKTPPPAPPPQAGGEGKPEAPKSRPEPGK